MMKILQLIETSEPGGAETVLLSLGKGLRGKGHYIAVGLLEKGWLYDQLKDADIEVIFLEQNQSYDLSCLNSLCRIIRSHQIDVVHTHEFMMNVYGSMAGVITGVPVITTVHGKNYYWEKFRRRFAYRLAARFSTMVAVSEDMKCFLAERVGISKGEIRTLHNGIALDHAIEYPTLRNVTCLREEFSIPRGSFVIGTVGMLVPVKGHATLLEAAAKVVKSRPDTIVLVVGEGELHGLLKEMAEQLGIKENVRFLGFRNDVPALLQIMDLYVCSSYSEGLSLAILEAMFAGKPVVATNIGGNPEIVLDGETGFLLPPKDHDELASKILWLLQHQSLAQMIGVNGRQRVIDKFSLDAMVNSYLQLYGECLKRK